MKKITKKQIWAIGISLTLVIVATLLLIATVTRTNHSAVEPQNLGEKLEYVGKQDLGGCVLWWCENQPYSEYYFATYMSEEELSSYFSKARLVSREREEYPLVDKAESRTQLGYTVEDSSDGFSLEYYDNTNHIITTYRLNQTQKAHVVRILDSSYEVAKSAL